MSALFTFVAVAALIVAVVLLLLLRPLLWRGTRKPAASHRQLNAAIHRDQLAELERDRGEGELGEDDYRQARAELQRRVLEDGAADEPGTTAPASSGRPKKTLLALALLLPTAAATLYLLLGTPAAIHPPAAPQQIAMPEIEAMVAGLAAKLEKNPDNPKGWAMLGRSYKVLRRFDDAVKAFERAGKFIDQDAQLLADYADALVARADGDFNGKPTQLIARALELDPDNAQALWLAGTAAFARKDFDTAIGHWQHLLTQLPPDSEDAQMIQAGIGKARDKATPVR